MGKTRLGSFALGPSTCGRAILSGSLHSRACAHATEGSAASVPASRILNSAQSSEVEADIGGRRGLGQAPDADIGDTRLRDRADRIEPHAA